MTDERGRVLICTICEGVLLNSAASSRREDAADLVSGRRLPPRLGQVAGDRVVGRLLDRRNHARHRGDSDERRRLELIVELSIERETGRMMQEREAAWRQVAAKLGLPTEATVDDILEAVDVRTGRRTLVPPTFVKAFQDRAP